MWEGMGRDRGRGNQTVVEAAQNEDQCHAARETRRQQQLRHRHCSASRLMIWGRENSRRAGEDKIRFADQRRSMFYQSPERQRRVWLDPSLTIRALIWETGSWFPRRGNGVSCSN